jgi:hypothetical protein
MHQLHAWLAANKRAAQSLYGATLHRQRQTQPAEAYLYFPRATGQTPAAHTRHVTVEMREDRGTGKANAAEEYHDCDDDDNAASARRAPRRPTPGLHQHYTPPTHHHRLPAARSGNALWTLESRDLHAASGENSARTNAHPSPGRPLVKGEPASQAPPGVSPFSLMASTLRPA